MTRLHCFIFCFIYQFLVPMRWTNLAAVCQLLSTISVSYRIVSLLTYIFVGELRYL